MAKEDDDKAAAEAKAAEERAAAEKAAAAAAEKPAITPGAVAPGAVKPMTSPLVNQGAQLAPSNSAGGASPLAPTAAPSPMEQAIQRQEAADAALVKNQEAELKNIEEGAKKKETEEAKTQEKLGEIALKKGLLKEHRRSMGFSRNDICHVGVYVFAQSRSNGDECGGRRHEWLQAGRRSCRQTGS
jgi:hypothetical protein